MVDMTNATDPERAKRQAIEKLHRGERVAQIGTTARPDVWRDPPAEVRAIGPFGIVWAQARD